MKTILTAALLTLTASSALAEAKLESRAYHSRLRLDASKMNEDFFNSHGIGVAALFSATDAIDFGMGYDIARYYPSHDVQWDLQSTSGFTRLTLAQGENYRLYARAGLTSQYIKQHSHDITDGIYTTQVSSEFSRLLNGDAGIGGLVRLGQVDMGLEYKYSNTLNKGHMTIKSRTRYFDLVGPQSESSQERLGGLTAETQEVALTLGVRI